MDVGAGLPAGLSWWAATPEGRRWLAELPGIVASCARRWSLRLAPPYEPATSAYVAPATTADGTPVVLKVNFPEPETAAEGDALAHYGGDGAVRLLALDRNRHALLLERCVPGGRLWEVADEGEANRHAAAVLRRLWERPAPWHGFRTLAGEAARWFEELPRDWERFGRPFPRRLLDEALARLRELPASQPRLVVAHQDLHGGNVLRAGRSPWLAVDPKPLAAEPAFDVASLLRDRREELRRDPAPHRRLARRLDQLAGDLALDRERVRGWAVVHALAWAFDARGLHGDHIRCAEGFAALARRRG